MPEVTHNKELIEAVAALKKRGVIRRDKEIVERTGYSKSTVSGYISGNVKASAEFLQKFENEFDIKLNQYQYNNGNTGQDQNNSRILTGANVTLQDHIDEIKKQRDMFYTLLNSTLGRMDKDQQTVIAYQKAWVDYEAERAAAGNPDKKAEIMYKMSKLVDEYLYGDTSIGIQNENDNSGRA